MPLSLTFEALHSSEPTHRWLMLMMLTTTKTTSTHIGLFPVVEFAHFVYRFILGRTDITKIFFVCHLHGLHCFKCFLKGCLSLPTISSESGHSLAHTLDNHTRLPPEKLQIHTSTPATLTRPHKMSDQFTFKFTTMVICNLANNYERENLHSLPDDLYQNVAEIQQNTLYMVVTWI